MFVMWNPPETQFQHFSRANYIYIEKKKIILITPSTMHSFPEEFKEHIHFISLLESQSQGGEPAHDLHQVTHCHFLSHHKEAFTDTLSFSSSGASKLISQQPSCFPQSDNNL